MSLTKQEIDKIVKETAAQLNVPYNNRPASSIASLDKPSKHPIFTNNDCWICDTAEQAIENAKASQKQLMNMTLEQRRILIEAMRDGARKNSRFLAELAHNETGYGNVADKTAKNDLAIEKTPGIEDLQTSALSGDDGLTIVEGAPYGVIGSITPSTNPTSTIINNSISMIAAGNAVVYNPHPAATRSSQETMRVLNEAIVAAGGPPALIACPKNPNMDTSKVIMEHKDTKILAITGGDAVVNIAMRVGKKVVAAGPGNPPAIVDQTADIDKAAKDIVEGASFDNNVLCIAEKEVFAVDTIADELIAKMQQYGAYKIQGNDIDKVVQTVLVQKDGKYIVNKDFVGRDATHILTESGVSYTEQPPLVIAEVNKDHPFIMVEMLMPVLGISRVANIDEAIESAIMAEQGCQHSAYIHSTNIHNMSRAAEELDTTIFVKNAPSLAGLGFGGEGCTTLTIATPTGEGITSAKTFTRSRRCVLQGDFRII